MLKGLLDYFNFNKGERSGILTVIALIVIVLLLPYFTKVTKKDNSDEFLHFAKDRPFRKKP
jgi:hypothetical protein